MKSSIRQIEAKIRLRNMRIAHFVKEHNGLQFHMPTRDGHVVVHRDLQNGKWRVTVFDENGPYGHYYYPNYEATVKGAVVEWGGDISKAATQ